MGQISVIVSVLGCIILLWLWAIRHKEWLYYRTLKGKLYLGFLGVGVIAIMDVMTSLFYAPGEAFRALHLHAIFFIPLTAILIAFYSMSMIEISRILEYYNYQGGGVYNFSYLVFGRNISLIAAASILVDFINTAAISSISAIENLVTFFPWIVEYKLFFELGIVGFIAFLNLIGIRESVKATFVLFMVVVSILSVTLILAFFNISPHSLNKVDISLMSLQTIYTETPMFLVIEYMVIGIGSTILAYSGIESLLQTQKYVGSWQTIRNSYFFIIIFIGIAIPLVSFFAISQIDEPIEHVGSLVTTFASKIGGEELGYLVLFAAVGTLIFAVNTALVAGVELLERMMERFGVKWLTVKNRFGASYREILLLTGAFCVILWITQGQQQLVADMYAIGLIATFILNLGALVIFRLMQGFEHLREFRTSLLKNALLLIIFIAVFFYIIEHKQSGAYLWVCASLTVVLLGVIATKIFKNPEQDQRETFNTRFDVVASFDINSQEDYHIVFLRPYENISSHSYAQVAYVTFGLSRLGSLQREYKNHFILPLETFWSLYSQIKKLIHSLYEWYPEKTLHIHFNWTSSSWHNRLFVVIFLNRILKLPKRYPHVNFHIDYRGL